MSGSMNSFNQQNLKGKVDEVVNLRNLACENTI